MQKASLTNFVKAKESYTHMKPKLQLDKFIFGRKIFTTVNIYTIPTPELQSKSIFTPCQNGIQALYSKYPPSVTTVPVNFS